MCTDQASAFWIALAAFGAAASAVIAAIYTAITYRLVRIQSEPKVIVYVRHDMERPSILMITIENIGRDIAHQVKFIPSRPVPARAFGLTSEKAKAASVMTAGPLIDGIPALGPGDRRDITWGQFGGLSKALGKEPIILEFSYSSGKRRTSGTAQLEVGSYAGTDASERPATIAARSLECIAQHMGSIVSLLAKHHLTGDDPGNDQDVK
jgi:hypothetical protein